MVDMCTVSAGLVLAVPVKPDLLGERLEAYTKVVPVLRTLRLCHRFGKRPQVHVTKLPVELELVIEKCIIRDAQHRRCRSKWVHAFYHYKDRCAPMDHGPSDPSLFYDEIDEIEQCDSCVEYFYDAEIGRCQTLCKATDVEKCWTCSQKRGDPENCMWTCQAKIQAEANGMAMDFASADLDGDCKGWEDMIDQANFAQYEKVLRQHFGLEAFLSKTRIAKEDHDTWPRDINHQWHCKEQLKTTICYLTLAQQLAPSKTYETGEMEGEFSGAILEGTQAIAVNPPATKDKIKARKRFGHAMNVLGLKVLVHSGQKATLVMLSYGAEEDDGAQQTGFGG